MACSSNQISYYQHTFEPYHHITFFQHTIDTLVTAKASAVDLWISETLHLNFYGPFVVGLDVEWRPCFSTLQNPVATLQLCTGRRCLIFQILRSNEIPQSLVNFLLNPSYTFAGVGIKNDVQKLGWDYNLAVGRTVDLGTLAANAYDEWDLKFAGLQKLSSRVLGKEIRKEKSVKLSDWDDVHLSSLQVEYAAIDAFVSFEIGWVLITGNHV